MSATDFYRALSAELVSGAGSELQVDNASVKLDIKNNPPRPTPVSPLLKIRYVPGLVLVDGDSCKRSPSGKSKRQMGVNVFLSDVEILIGLDPFEGQRF